MDKNYPGEKSGTTSAHAENTSPRNRMPGCPWNYLRARGEYHVQSFSHDLGLELPPRTRRIRNIKPMRGLVRGTTSAHAENT